MEHFEQNCVDDGKRLHCLLEGSLPLEDVHEFSQKASVLFVAECPVLEFPVSKLLISGQYSPRSFCHILPVLQIEGQSEQRIVERCKNGIFAAKLLDSSIICLEVMGEELGKLDGVVVDWGKFLWWEFEL